MRVAVPTQLAGAGDRMPGGHQGGDGDSVHLRKDAGGQGKEKLKAWLGTCFQVTSGFFETGALRGEAEGRAEPLFLPHRRQPRGNKCPMHAAPLRNPNRLLHD